MSAKTAPPTKALDLVNAAVIVRLAQTLTAPRLAVQAARRCRALADAVVIELSPMLAAVTEDAEDDALAGVRLTADLAALLHPNDREDETP